jgi:hypothetical protein
MVGGLLEKQRASISRLGDGAIGRRLGMLGGNLQEVLEKWIRKTQPVRETTNRESCTPVSSTGGPLSLAGRGSEMELG